MSSEIRIVGLVANDLTGATDSAVQFAEAGWTASVERVSLRQQDELSGDRPAVIAVATGVRAAAAAHAADRTAAIGTRGRPAVHKD